MIQSHFGDGLNFQMMDAEDEIIHRNSESSASASSSGYTSLNSSAYSPKPPIKHSSNESRPENLKNAKKQTQVQRYASPIERILSVFVRVKKFAKTHSEGREPHEKIDWNKYTDPRLPFSGREYKTSRATTPGGSRSHSPGPRPVPVEPETPVRIIDFEREPTPVRSSRPPVKPKPPEESKPESVPRSSQTNLVETCFLDKATQADLLERTLSVRERRKSMYDFPKRSPVNPNRFRVSTFDRPMQKQDSPEVVVTPPASLSTPKKSKLPVPIPGLIRQRTSDSGFSNNSSPPISTATLPRSLSPTFSMSSEPVTRRRSPSSRTGSLRLPRRPASVNLDYRRRSPLPPTRPGHRHEHCLTPYQPPPPTYMGNRVAPTMLRIENDPRPSRCKHSPPKILEPTPELKLPVLHVSEEEIKEKVTPRNATPAARIKQMLSDEKCRGEMRMGKSLSLASGEFSEIFVVNLSKAPNGRPASLIFLGEDQDIQNWLDESPKQS